jgi:lysozyme family protein
MTKRFNAFIPFILKWETEFNKDGSVRTENDPDDPGGKTRYGIDKRSHPGVDIPNLTKNQAIAIYYVEWQFAKSEMMPANLGEVYFNARVNCGVGRAQKLLVIAHDDALAYILAEDDFYKRLVVARPKSEKYLGGWLNRMGALRKFLGL